MRLMRGKVVGAEDRAELLRMTEANAGGEGVTDRGSALREEGGMERMGKLHTI